MSELNHPPVVWRGYELKQWLASKRVVHLQGITSRGVRINLIATYKGGKPYSYKAEVFCHGVNVEKFGEPDVPATTVLDYCFLAIEQAYHALLKEKQDETVREQT